MHIHILGICGTFMGGLALIAKQQGHQVSGSDEAVYPPISTQLAEQGITVIQGYTPDPIAISRPDCVIIGNVISRGNPAVEYVLNENIPYFSGPEWLAKYVLSNHWVLAVSGTHGKTTTASMIAWILEYSGLPAGFLIGGIPKNFGISSRFTNTPFFVIEADEYDSAFFDKRSKFLHFHPRTLVINSLEYDHADIFPDLESIQQQFQYLLRNVPGNGLVIAANKEKNIQEVLSRGCWTPIQTFNGETADWKATDVVPDASRFKVEFREVSQGEIHWQLIGQHNLHNALAAIAAAYHVGVSPKQAIRALNQFQGVKRRLELRGQIQGVSVYEDFAHHPTAINTTLNGLRAKVGDARIIVAIEFASYSMRVGAHRENLAAAFKEADFILALKPQLNWNLEEWMTELPMPAHLHENVDDIITDILCHVQIGDQILILSNRSFDGIYTKLLQALQQINISAYGQPILS